MSSDLMQLLVVLSQLPLDANVPKPSLVKESVFVGIIWGATAVSFLFICGRLITRLHTFGRLWFDDFFVIVGWLFILVSAIIWHFAERAMFLSTEVSAGQLSPLDYPTYIPDTEHYLKSTVATMVLFYSSLAAIKISFLLFFRRLLSGVHIKALRIQWWTVLAITIISWIISIADLEYKCLAAPFIQIVQNCTRKDSIRFQRITYIVNCVMDVTTDVLIITIPIAILWNVRISLKHRLALAGLFGLTIITMIIAIIRVAVVLEASEQPDVSWLYLWSFIEPPVAVIISCLVSFRALFGVTERKTRPTGTYFSKGGYSIMSNPWRRLVGGSKDENIEMKNMPKGSNQMSGNKEQEDNRTASREQILDSEYSKRGTETSCHV